jgi:beta-lactamase class A
MRSKTLTAYVVVLVTGMAIGVAAHVLLLKVKNNGKEIAYTEKREGQMGYINPLLACDVAEDVIRSKELVPFKNDIEAYLKTGVDKRWSKKVSVYFRELNDGYWFSIGDTEKFTPASLRKVPLMIALLKEAEKESGLLDRSVRYDLANDYNLNQNIKPSKTLVKGNTYTVREMIYRMIVYSDNNAFTFLTKLVNPAQFDKVYSDLRLQNPRALKDDDYLSIQTYESFFRILYNASYLSRESSNWALDIMSKSEFRTGLVAGVPPNVTVSHKFGEKSDANDGTVQLHDCGIVYYPRHPYLLCVMSQGSNFELLDDVIAEISRISFTTIDRQHSRH